MLLIIGLGGYWAYTNPGESHISLSHVSDWLPDFSQDGIGAGFTAVVLSLTGLEITTSYASEVENPQRRIQSTLSFYGADFDFFNSLLTVNFIGGVKRSRQLKRRCDLGVQNLL